MVMVNVEREGGRNNSWVRSHLHIRSLPEGSPTVAPSEVRRSDLTTGGRGKGCSRANRVDVGFGREYAPGSAGCVGRANKNREAGSPCKRGELTASLLINSLTCVRDLDCQRVLVNLSLCPFWCVRVRIQMRLGTPRRRSGQLRPPGDPCFPRHVIFSR
jgi:hypothetical protein